MESIFIFLFSPPLPFALLYFFHIQVPVSGLILCIIRWRMLWTELGPPQLISWCPNGTLFGNWAFKVVSEGKWGPEGGTMVHGMSVLMRRKCGHTQSSRNARPQRKGHVRTQWEGGHLQTKDRAAPGESKPANTWSRTSSLPDNKKMNFCCLSHQHVVFCYSSPSKLTQV